MSFGFGPYGLGVGGLPVAPIPSETQGSLVSSRLIDANNRFVQTGEANGDFKATTDTMQRVCNILAFEVKQPDKIEADYPTTMDSLIRTALSVLTDGNEPVAEIVSIDVADRGMQTATHVVIRDLTDGKIHTVQPRTR